MKQIGHDSKVGCVLDVDMKPEVPWDRSVYGHAVINYGGIWNLDGRYFAGVNDYIDCGNDSSLDITDAITIETWIYPTKSQPWCGIISKYTNYILKYEGNGLRPVFRIVPSVSGGVSLPVLNDVPLNQFSHIVATYNNRTGAKIYLNGVLSNSDDTLSGNLTTNNEALSIGALNTTPVWLFTGSIKSTRIYNHELPLSKILSLYKH